MSGEAAPTSFSRQSGGESGVYPDKTPLLPVRAPRMSAHSGPWIAKPSKGSVAIREALYRRTSSNEPPSTIPNAA